MVKMADVALSAGVSITTVSHVLNDTRPVSDELRQRVFKAVNETGYTPNSVARALVTQSTMLIGVVMSFLSNPFFAPLVTQIDRTARRRGYTLLLTENHENATDEVTQVKVMLDRRVDGIIIAPYQWYCRMTVDWYYTWDCASGCIWNLDAIESVNAVTAVTQ